MIDKLIFTESLGFEDMGIAIELGVEYKVTDEFDGVVYIEDESGNKIGFEIKALDETVVVVKKVGQVYEG